MFAFLNAIAFAQCGVSDSVPVSVCLCLCACVSVCSEEGPLKTVSGNVLEGSITAPHRILLVHTRTHTHNCSAQAHTHTHTHTRLHRAGRFTWVINALCRCNTNKLSLPPPPPLPPFPSLPPPLSVSLSLQVGCSAGLTGLNAIWLFKVVGGIWKVEFASLCIAHTNT
jgi:hypothetical protein